MKVYRNRAEADAMMREGYAPIDAMNINELEIFAKDDNNKVYLAIYANCLLKARQTNKYKEVNRFRRKIGMSTLP